MIRPARLFVYGTLRRGQPNRWARFLARHSVWEGAARMRGVLGRQGRHKALVKGQGWVAGEIFRMADPAGVFAVLDEYEGPGYRRRLAPAVTAKGVPTRVWRYEKALVEFASTAPQRVN